MVPFRKLEFNIANYKLENLCTVSTPTELVYHADAFYQHVPSAYYRSFLQILRQICSHIRLDGPGAGVGERKKRNLHGCNTEPAASSLELPAQLGTAWHRTDPHTSKGAQKIRGQRQNKNHK